MSSNIFILEVKVCVSVHPRRINFYLCVSKHNNYSSRIWWGGGEFVYLFKSCLSITTKPNQLRNDQLGTQCDGL